MSVIYSTWNDLSNNFNTQFNNFNKLNFIKLEINEINPIYKSITNILANFTKLSEQLEKRKKELEQSFYLTDRFTKATKWTEVASRILTTAGGSAAIFQEDPIVRGVGVGLFAAGNLVEAILLKCASQVLDITKEIGTLEKIKPETLKTVQTFKKFLDELINIKKKEEFSLAQQKSFQSLLFQEPPSDPDPRPLDKCIEACFEQYDYLPAEFKNNHVYSGLLCSFLNSTPKEDPLHKELNQLETDEDEPDITSSALGELPTEYLDHKENQRSKIHNLMPLEELTRTNSTPELTRIDPEFHSAFSKKYREKIALFKLEVVQRFKLKTDIQTIFTSNGYEIDIYQGTRKKVSTPKSEQRSLTIETQS